jgi:adenosylcobyric acid synthase
VSGSYIHGMFSNDAFRSAFLQGLGATASAHRYGATVESTLDQLAAHLETHLDVAGLLGLAR